MQDRTTLGMAAASSERVPRGAVRVTEAAPRAVPKRDGSGALGFRPAGTAEARLIPDPPWHRKDDVRKAARRSLPATAALHSAPDPWGAARMTLAELRAIHAGDAVARLAPGLQGRHTDGEIHASPSRAGAGIQHPDPGAPPDDASHAARCLTMETVAARLAPVPR